MSKSKKQNTEQTNEYNEPMIGAQKGLSLCVEVTGLSSLIQNNFGQKTAEQMLKKHMGITVQREPKRPRDVIESAKVKNTDGVLCLPPTAFKLGIVTASASVKTFQRMKGQLRTSVFVEGQSIPFHYATEVARMDMCRTATGMPDIRFRPEFRGWSARFVITFPDTISSATMIDLINRAGQVGVGEWRPEKNGTFGTYCVSRVIADPKEIKEVTRACSVPLVGLQVPAWALDANIDPTLIAKIFDSDLEEVDAEEVVAPPAKKNGASTATA